MLTEQYREEDGIKIFHDDIDDNNTDYNLQGLDNLYKEEERHFWFIVRKEFIFEQMKKVIDKSSKIIETGSGTGNVSRYLSGKGFANISVGEMHRHGLRYAKSYGIDECYQFDLLRTPFNSEFDVVCMFDVLEHIEEDCLALENVYKMLKNDGQIVLSVPAHQWLWNRSDVIAGHKRRYTKKSLNHALNSAGFDVVVSKYFFISIIPLLYLRTLLNKDAKQDERYDERTREISMYPVMNKILLSVSRIENKINKFLPNIIGGSLFVIARKR